MSSFGRTLIVNVAGKQFKSAIGVQSLRVAFSVERDKTKWPNNAAVAIYNLAESTRSDLADQGSASVILEAGYDTDVTQIFNGILRKIESVKEGADWITTLSSGDGEDALVNTHISRSFAIGTPYLSIVAALAGDLGLGVGNLALFAASLGVRVLETALTLDGPVQDVLDDFCTSTGFSFSVQDGVLQFSPNGLPTTPIPAALLSDPTGLITARLDQKGQVSGRALLNADIIPGSLVAIASTRIQGAFVMNKTVHSGDSTAQDWYVDFTGAPL